MANLEKKYQKYVKFVCLVIGQFYCNEWAILGMFCGNIQQLAYVIIDCLSEVYNVGYVDVDYVYGDDEFFYDGVMAYGVCLNYMDKIYYYCFDQQAELGMYQFWW